MFALRIGTDTRFLVAHEDDANRIYRVSERKEGGDIERTLKSDATIACQILPEFRSGEYLEYTMVAEDSVVVFPRSVKVGNLVCTDALTGVSWTSKFVSREDAIRVLQLMVHGAGDEAFPDYYPSIAAIFEECPRECRPIP